MGSMPEEYRRRIPTKKLKSENGDFDSFDSTKFKVFEQNEVDLDDGSFGFEESRSKQPSARSRWRRLKYTVSLVNHITANIKSNNGGAGGVRAATFEGVSTRLSGGRLKGRRGMEELVVKQDKSFVSLVQDLYVACLKLPILHFLMGVFLAPVLLGLLFMPLYFLDIDGLRFDGVMDEVNRTVSSTKRYLCILNVFLYALSLSTTFGGSPVVAVSPFCLVVANINTLMAQFLFVFLSGAGPKSGFTLLKGILSVFARMSQPSHPIRCAKKAIIKTDDVTINPAEDLNEIFSVFAVRLVLTGPTPCELVDAKICLTFRIFNKLPDGSTFCSTHDLELVRPEVSYLQYGLMVRHVINQKSPVYGHTLESLKKGDASFSLTVMGLERSSMQPIFHLEDYFVSDGEVVWDGDYVDFIHINGKGQRVLDHTAIDLLKLNKVSPAGTQSVSQHVNTTQKNTEPCVPRSISGQGSLSFRDLWASAINQQRLFKCKSTSFTRAGY